MNYKDQRISLTTDVINGIKQIKYLHWEAVFYKKIKKIRLFEFNYLKLSKYLDAFCVFFWACTSTIIATTTFLTFIWFGHNLKENNIFTVNSYYLITLNRHLHCFKCSFFH